MNQNNQQPGSADLPHDAERLKRYLQSCAGAVGDNIAGHLETLDALIAASRRAACGDGCKFCLGAKGGVPGNANRIGGELVCDYCTSLLLTIRDAERAQPTGSVFTPASLPDVAMHHDPALVAAYSKGFEKAQAIAAEGATQAGPNKQMRDALIEAKQLLALNGIDINDTADYGNGRADYIINRISAAIDGDKQGEA